MQSSLIKIPKIPFRINRTGLSATHGDARARTTYARARSVAQTKNDREAGIKTPKRLYTCPIRLSINLNKATSLDSTIKTTDSTSMMQSCNLRGRLSKIVSRLPKELTNKRARDKCHRQSDVDAKRLPELDVALSIDKKETEDEDQKSSKDVFENVAANEILSSPQLGDNTGIDIKIRNTTDIKKSIESRSRGITTPRRARSKIDVDIRHIKLGTKLPLGLQISKNIPVETRFPEWSHTTFHANKLNRHNLIIKSKDVRQTRLHVKKIESTCDKTDDRGWSTASILNKPNYVGSLALTAGADQKKSKVVLVVNPMVAVATAERSPSQEPAPILTNFRSTQMRRNNAEAAPEPNVTQPQPGARKRPLSRFPGIPRSKICVSDSASQNPLPESPNTLESNPSSIALTKNPQEDVTLKNKKSNDEKSVNERRSIKLMNLIKRTQSPERRRRASDNRTRQKEFSDKVKKDTVEFRNLQGLLDKKLCTSPPLRERRFERHEENKDIAATVGENLHENLSPREGKNWKPKPILRKASGAEVLDCTEGSSDSSQGSTDQVQKRIKVRFNLPGSEGRKKGKKCKTGKNLLKEEISVLKDKSRMIVEEDTDVQFLEIGGKKCSVMIGSDLSNEMEFSLLEEENSYMSIIKDEVEIKNYELGKTTIESDGEEIYEETKSSLDSESCVEEESEKFDELSVDYKMKSSQWNKRSTSDLKQMVEREYRDKLLRLNDLVTKLKIEQDIVMKVHSAVTEMYDGLKKQKYNVEPSENLLIVALGKVKDFLIAGQLANRRSSTSSGKLSDDVMYTVCVPSAKVLQGDKFLKEFEIKLQHFADRSNQTAMCIKEKLNWFLSKFKSGTLHKRNSDELLNEGEVSQVLCDQLKNDLRNYSNDIMTDMKDLLKQNQLLCQLEKLVTRKLEEMADRHKDQDIAQQSLEELQKENTRLLKVLEENNNVGSDPSSSGVSSEVDRLKRDLTSLSHECSTVKDASAKRLREMHDKLLAEKERFTRAHTENERYRQLTEATIQLYSASKLSVAALTETHRKEVESFETEKQALKTALTATKEELETVAALRADCENTLRVNELYIEKRDKEVDRLIRLNDPRYRHPYPLRNSNPTEREKRTWVELQRVRTVLRKTRQERTKISAERDEMLASVGRFLISKHPNPSDADSPLVGVTTKATAEMRDQIRRLTETLQTRTTESEQLRVEATRLRRIVAGMEGGLDVANTIRDNYNLKEQVRVLHECGHELGLLNERLDEQLRDKMFENMQRDRAMAEQCAAFEARERLAALLQERRAAVEAGARPADDACTIKTWLPVLWRGGAKIVASKSPLETTSPTTKTT